MAFVGLGIDMPQHQQSRIITEPRSPLYHAPRSLGVLGGFVSSPKDLPRTLYTRDPATNPLIPLPQSPLLELPLAHHNPGLHLRAMKKRSIANRNFGQATNEGLEPLHGIVAPHPAEVSDSPTMMNSPTLPSPTVPSAPAMSEDKFANHPLFVSSIALSVLIGLILLGVGSWAGVKYRRRRTQQRQDRSEKDVESSPKLSVDYDTFAASNVVEKGLRPRHSSISWVTRPDSRVSREATADDRRVSFIDDPGQRDSFMSTDEQPYMDEPEVSMTRSRMRSSTLSAIERVLTSSRPNSFISLVSTLDPIEEETDSVRSSPPSHQRRASTPILCSHRHRTDSLASTMTGSSAYTTASARSSVSDLTTLSTISCLSSFPDTPRSEQRNIMREAQVQHDSPSKSSWSADRKARAQSQTIISVKQIGPLRTAVGRTMSLQPSKQVVAALHEMTEVENLKALQELIKGRDELIFNTEQPLPIAQVITTIRNIEQVEVMEEGDETLVEDIDVQDIARPENGMKKVLFDLEANPLPPSYHDISPISSPVTRSRSFPSKLLARRKSATRNTGTRRSEVISDGYLKRALRALRGEEDSMPPMPGAFYQTQSRDARDEGDEAEDERRADRRHSSDSTCTERSTTSLESNDDEHLWGSASQFTELDAYYLDLEEGFGLGSAPEDEEDIPGHFSHPETHLPHIRVTSH